jgi:TRAP-type C4-dicarboxylate transport system permease small subunit
MVIAYLRTCDKLIEAAEFVVKLLMLAMTVDVLMGVFFRYVLANALTWTEEVGRYLLIWMGYLAAAPGLRRGNHVAVDVLLTVTEGRTRRAVVVLSRALSLLFLLSVVGLGLMLLPRLRSHSAALAINMVWPYLAVPVGCLLTTLELVALMLRGGDDAEQKHSAKSSTEAA